MTIESSTKQASGPAAEHTIRTLLDQIQNLQSQIQTLQEKVSALESGQIKAADRYVAVCTACQTRFDLLAHHYSIGLFDNLVYAKCPKCQKAFPIKGGSGGDVRIVPD